MIFHVTLGRPEDGWIVAECPALRAESSRVATTRKP